MKTVDKQKLHTEVANILLSFEEPFTLKEVYKLLREKKIMTDKNKGTIIKIIDDIFESCLIRTVPFTNKYVFRF